MYKHGLHCLISFLIELKIELVADILLYRNHSTSFYTMSSTKYMSISASDLPKFDGRHYKQWLDKIEPMFRYMDLLGVLNGVFIAPVTGYAEPAIPTGVPNAAGQPTDPTAEQWSQYNAQLSQFERQSKLQMAYDDKVVRAMGALNLCLSFGIWEQVKNLTIKVDFGGESSPLNYAYIN